MKSIWFHRHHRYAMRLLSLRISPHIPISPNSRGICGGFVRLAQLQCEALTAASRGTRNTGVGTCIVVARLAQTACEAPVDGLEALKIPGLPARAFCKYRGGTCKRLLQERGSCSWLSRYCWRVARLLSRYSCTSQASCEYPSLSTSTRLRVPTWFA